MEKGTVKIMKLKTRLKIAFCAVILVPIILFGAAILGFSQYQVKAIEKTYGIDFSLETLSNSVQIISQSTEAICEKLKSEAKRDSDRFLNFAYLEEINQELEEKCSYLLVRKNNEVFYK